MSRWNKPNDLVHGGVSAALIQNVSAGNTTSQFSKTIFRLREAYCTVQLL